MLLFRPFFLYLPTSRLFLPFPGILVNTPAATALACGYLDLSPSGHDYINLGQGIGAVVASLSSYSFASWVNYRTYRRNSK